MTAILRDTRQYICPGETHPISHSVHLARLAAFFPGCRDCPFRTETGQLARQTVERLQRTEKRVERKSLVTNDGIRGRYVNELNRKKADEFAAALATLLWRQSPLVGHLDSGRRRNRKSGPVVVVGHDERTSSPDIVTGVVSALRRTGCGVVDISLCSEPCFRFTVDHLQAAAGIYVTGAGCDPSWTGLDIVTSGAIPVGCRSVPADEPYDRDALERMTLEVLEQMTQAAVGRPTRQAGPHRSFQSSIPYDASLLKHFHALRPLRVTVGCSSRLVRQTLDRLFQNLPCRLLTVEIPDRARHPGDATDADVLRVGKAVVESESHLGVLIDHDGSRCGFVDEEGRLVAPRRISHLMCEAVLAEHSGGTVAVERPAYEEIRTVVEDFGGRCVAAEPVQTDMARTLQAQRAVLGVGDSGRYWFGEAFPSSDAILTLARVLESLSKSDALFSHVASDAPSSPE